MYCHWPDCLLFSGYEGEKSQFMGKKPVHRPWLVKMSLLGKKNHTDIQKTKQSTIYFWTSKSWNCFIISVNRLALLLWIQELCKTWLESVQSMLKNSKPNSCRTRNFDLIWFFRCTFLVYFRAFKEFSPYIIIFALYQSLHLPSEIHLISDFRLISDVLFPDPYQVI